MAYLTYIIDHYYTLPSTIAFLHSHRSGFRQAWHTDAPFHDNVFAIKNLRVDTVQRYGYVNLRCKRNPGCVRVQSKNGHITERVWEQVFRGTSTWPDKNSSHPLRNSQTWAVEVKDTKMPSHISVACCSQFAVSRMQVLKRPLKDYVNFRQWVIDTELDDAHSGRVMEYLWHIIFSMDAVHYPDEETCYCDVYGRWWLASRLAFVQRVRVAKKSRRFLEDGVDAGPWEALKAKLCLFLRHLQRCRPSRLVGRALPLLFEHTLFVHSALWMPMKAVPAIHIHPAKVTRTSSVNIIFDLMDDYTVP